MVLYPLPEQFERGGIVGVAEVWEVATGSSSPWFTGPFALRLRESKPLPFVPIKGRLGPFDVTGESTGAGMILAAAIRQDGVVYTLPILWG
ncbi:MAG: hypothetical protein P4L85_01970 [Paludisphaera borealis]|uniref:hypothetical protein n=1 Tax=Paludisphaera borealis TaxID=1387353 RepID=UPI0028468096|nr:hypothetical protein [Paludisphaera borealis]MDR3618088.1 hypothetical protein [Paludisphaera borealis]